MSLPFRTEALAITVAVNCDGMSEVGVINLAVAPEPDISTRLLPVVQTKFWPTFNPLESGSVTIIWKFCVMASADIDWPIVVLSVIGKEIVPTGGAPKFNVPTIFPPEVPNEIFLNT